MLSEHLATWEARLIHYVGIWHYRRRDIIRLYAAALRSDDAHTIDWARIDKAIADRWSSFSLGHIKRHAHKRANVQALNFKRLCRLVAAAKAVDHGT